MPKDVLFPAQAERLLRRNNNLAPSPVPGADGNYQLMTSIHDGFHTTSPTIGPIINNCSFIGAGAPFKKAWIYFVTVLRAA